jgi:hypothetical protein
MDDRNDWDNADWAAYIMPWQDTEEEPWELNYDDE